VYSSVWFSAIYILLFISLIGCVIPRTKHHFKALRAARRARRAPVAPRRPRRGGAHRRPRAGCRGAASRAVDLAQAQLRKAGYRVERYDTPATGKRPAVASVSAERGYARETGNLVFHAALVGVLSRSASAADSPTPGRPSSSRATASSTLGLGYTSFNPGRFVDTTRCRRIR
jgi:cytochrome c biogenesis protein